jgi:hypothetical protein
LARGQQDARVVPETRDSVSVFASKALPAALNAAAGGAVSEKPGTAAAASAGVSIMRSQYSTASLAIAT